MWIPIGSRRVLIATHKTRTGICSNCGHQFTLVYKIFRKHLRFLFIPTIPFFKRGHAECSNCKILIGEKDMSEAIRKEFIEVKKETRGPLWQYAGILVFGLFFLWIFQGAKENNIKESALINHPMKNDVYRVKTGHKTVTFWKVKTVTMDSIAIIPNKFEASKILDQVNIQEDKNYLDSTFTISRQQLVKWFENNKISSIKRK